MPPKPKPSRKAPKRGKKTPPGSSSSTPKNGSSLRLYLLDVGTQQYGDCILCQLGNRSILVDGGHPSDFRGTTGHDSIPTQLEQIFGHRAPFPIDLLVATHCHLDHIGCLPDLVANDLEVKWALVADETMGFPSASDMGGDAKDNHTYRLVAALTEENYADGLDDASTSQFLQDAARLQDRYSTMLAQLAKQGTLVRYQGPDTPGLVALVKEFSDFGLEILGPTNKQLVICEDYLKSATQDLVEQVSSLADARDAESDVALYRRLAREVEETDAQDRPGPGAAKNNQSTVLKLEVGGHKVLLTGDMQFAASEVPNLDESMSELLQVVNQAGPYSFIKLAHHGSYNGLDASVLGTWDKTLAFGCSSGTNDASHPNPEVLNLLKKDPNNIEWARTDKNGLVTVVFEGDKPTIETSRGKLNDATPPAGASRKNDSLAPAESPRSLKFGQVVDRPDGFSEFAGKVELEGATFSFSLKVPTSTSERPVSETRTGGTSQGSTRDVAGPGPDVPPRPVALSKPLGGKRTLPKLLFVTHTPKLVENIGSEESAQALRLVRDAGQTVLEVKNQQNPFPEVRDAIRKLSPTGVVLLGGYDILAAQRLDVLDPDLRRAIGSQAGRDGDNFIVWSDEAYGDVNGDSVQEIPVSRIPDAKSSVLVFAALGAPSGNATVTRFGVRNVAREFATTIYGLLPGRNKLLVSSPTGPNDVGTAKIDETGIYLMLHGSDSDGSRFWGEDNGDMFEAVNVRNLASAGPSVVFTGCCWGALTVERIASRSRTGDPIAVRTVEASMALSFLQGGATAFVGCTGSHYSPLQKPYRYYGGPMHEAFWKRYNELKAPAVALHTAKQDFLKAIPHGRTTDIGHAIELKILREYTCLGLGW
jgi:beta-lactamase superfamily II metal-dependent hydrolase